MKIHDGDFLTFASIGTAVGVMPLDQQITFRNCEVAPGIWRRHPQIGKRSRSDISRDGYLGVMFEAAVNRRKDVLKRIIKAGWRRGWSMGDRGNFDYVNIYPLVPTLYMLFLGKWFPTLPTWIPDIPKYTTGYRAHLTALHILTEVVAGKDRWSHRDTMSKLYLANPENPWFITLRSLVFGLDTTDYRFEFSDQEAAYGWGSCPAEVFKGLTEFTIKLGSKNYGA